MAGVMIEASGPILTRRLSEPSLTGVQAGQSATASTAGLVGATEAGLADAPKFVGDLAPAAKGLGGAGLGAVWGRELAEKMLEQAWFSRVRVESLPHDMINLYYVAC